MIGRARRIVSFLLNAGILGLLAACAGPDLVGTLAEPAPSDFSDAVRGELAPSGLRIQRGGRPLADLWFRRSVPTGRPKVEEGVLYGALQAGSLIGAVRVHAEGRDFRNQKLPVGLYTMRYDVQPDDGEHLGLTETRDFLLLIAAADDRATAALGEDDLHKLSSKLHAKKHPAVLLLAETQDGPAPRLRARDASQKLIVEADAADAAGKPLRLAIVLVGKYKE
jgi:hypothetical protein